MNQERTALPHGLAIDPLSFAVLEDGSIYIGKDSGVVKYTGYVDGTASYQLRYFSNPLDFGSAANLKFLKKFNLTIIGEQPHNSRDS